MTSRLDRLTFVMRWAVLAWIVYCAIQMVRWWHFQSPAMVVGWYWMGSVWGCLLCLIRRSPADRNEWGARIALFGPTLLFICEHVHKVSVDSVLGIGLIRCFPQWNCVFDFALLTWGWDPHDRRVRSMLMVLLMVGIIGISMSLIPSTAYTLVAVGIVAGTAVYFLRKSDTSLRPQGLVLGGLLLAFIDLILLTPSEVNQVFIWGLPAQTRLGILSFVAWRLSSPRDTEQESESVSGSGFVPFYTRRAIRVIAWSGLILWTWFACWLYPRCVATMSCLNDDPGIRLLVNEDAPDLLTGHDFLSDIWLASQQVHHSLEVRPDGDRIPEYLFAIQEVEDIVVTGIATPELRNKLRRFPKLKSVREDIGFTCILMKDVRPDENPKTEDAPIESE